MDNSIKIFKNDAFGEVRVAGTSEEPLFCLADVCNAVELSNPSSVKTRLNDEDLQPLDLHALNPDLKVIPNYSRYAVDIFGNVYGISYNKTGKIKMMKQRKNRYGYMQVQLFDDNKKSRLLSVHRLAAISFIPFIKGKEYVNHIDGNKSNNNVPNLGWCSLSENTKHPYEAIKTQSYSRLSNIGKTSAKMHRKFTKEEVDSIRDKHNIHHISFRKPAKEYNCGKTVIERIVNRVTYAC